MRTHYWTAIVLAVAMILSGHQRAEADQQSCAEFRQSIVDMEATSARPAGWNVLDLYLRTLYADMCVENPTRRPPAEWWYRADGTPLGIPATAEPPEDGAYTTTPEIAAACRLVVQLTPGMCALIKGAEVSCRDPVDSRQRKQCESILNGEMPNLPTPSEPLPPLQALLGPPQPGIASSSNAVIAADPGFQRMCAAARANEATCRQRRENIRSVDHGPQGFSGQAGAFYQCRKLYGSVLGMCDAVATGRMPRLAVASPRSSASPQKPGDRSGGSSPPPAQASCPSGSVSNADGFCLRPGQQYCGGGMMCSEGMACRSDGRCFYASGCFPGEVMGADGFCGVVGSVDCGNGRSCNPGEHCLPGGGCGGGPSATGPMCSDGRRAQAGWLCAPAGGTYNPQKDRLCGSGICDLRAECTAAGDCRIPRRPPFVQTAAPKGGK